MTIPTSKIKVKQKLKSCKEKKGEMRVEKKNNRKIKHLFIVQGLSRIGNSQIKPYNINTFFFTQKDEIFKFK